MQQSIVKLFSQSELRNNCTITLNIYLIEITKKTAAMTNHLQQATTRMMILLVLL